MKKLFFIAALASISFVACKNEAPKEGEGATMEAKTEETMEATPEAALVMASDTASVKFQCPMKCQGDTMYTTAGKCPTCHMEITKM